MIDSDRELSDTNSFLSCNRRGEACQFPRGTKEGYKVAKEFAAI